MVFPIDELNLLEWRSLGICGGEKRSNLLNLDKHDWYRLIKRHLVYLPDRSLDQ